LKFHDVAIKILGFLVVKLEPVLVKLGTDLHGRMDGSAVVTTGLDLLHGLCGDGEPKGCAIGSRRALVKFFLLIHIIFMKRGIIFFLQNFYASLRKDRSEAEMLVFVVVVGGKG
jgi:hypothetical protein